MRADLALLAVTLIWGTTFVVVKQTLDALPPVVLVSCRFWAAGLALLGIFLAGKRRSGFGPQQSHGVPLRVLLREGGVTGVVLACGFVTQTMGLQTTEAGKSAFITGLNVVIVPVLAVLLLREPPARVAVVGVALSAVGLGLLTLDRTLHLAPGDVWTLACAGCFALHIICTAHFAPRHAALPFTLVQLFTVAGLTLLAAALFYPQMSLARGLGEWGVGAPSRAGLLLALPAVLYLGVIATALVFGLQTWAQRHTTPTHTALIFALEPVFAAIFAVLLAGEVLTHREWAGGVLILLGMLLAELWPAFASSKEWVPNNLPKSN